MAVDLRPDRLDGHQVARQAPFVPCRLLAEFRWQERQIEGLVDLLLGPRRDRRDAAVLRRLRIAVVGEQPVFVEPHRLLDRDLAHADVVFLAPGEVEQCGAEGVLVDDPQVDLDAGIESHAGLGVPGEEHLLDARRLLEDRGRSRRVLGGGEDVDVTDRLPAPAQAACVGDAGHAGRARDPFHQGFGERQRGSEPDAAGASFAELDRIADVREGLRAHPRDVGERPASIFDLSVSTSVTRPSPRGLDRLGPEAGNIEHVDRPAVSTPSGRRTHGWSRSPRTR